LGRAFLETGEYSKAGLAYAHARDAFLLLAGKGLEKAGARNLIAEAGPLFAEAAFVALQQGDIEAGLLLAGEGRARLLAVTMKLQTLELFPRERSKLDELRAGVRVAEQLLEGAQGTDRAAALEKLVALRQGLLNVVKAQHSKLGDPSAAFAEARALAATGAMIAIP